MSIAIRQARNEEREILVPQLAAILLDAVEDGASVGFMAALAEADAERFWRESLDGVAKGDRVIFVASREDVAVGTVTLHLIGKPNQPHRAEIAKLLVRRSARRQRIAQGLMARAEAEAMRRGRWLLVLDTDAASPARALYRGLGYREVGVISDFALMPDGAPCHTMFMYKHLNGPPC